MGKVTFLYCDKCVRPTNYTEKFGCLICAQKIDTELKLKKVIEVFDGIWN